MSNHTTSATSPASNASPASNDAALSRPQYHGHQAAIWVFIAMLYFGHMTTQWGKWAVGAMALVMVCYHVAYSIRKTR